MQTWTKMAKGMATAMASCALLPVAMTKAVPMMPPMTTFGGCAPASGTRPIHISSKDAPATSPACGSPMRMPTMGPAMIGRWMWVRTLKRSMPASPAKMATINACRKVT